MIWMLSSPFRPGRSSTENKQKVTMDKPYQIAKYPVTNRAVPSLCGRGGYEKREYWSARGWSWRTGTYDSQAPKDWGLAGCDRKRNVMNPSTGMTWNGTTPLRPWLA